VGTSTSVFAGFIRTTEQTQQAFKGDSESDHRSTTSRKVTILVLKILYAINNVILKLITMAWQAAYARFI